MQGKYGEMAEWIGTNGFAPTGSVYENYYNGPEFPESKYLTKISMHVRKPEWASVLQDFLDENEADLDSV